jgi:protein TonB
LGPLGRRSARQAYQRRFVVALALAGGLHVSLTAAMILLRLESHGIAVEEVLRPPIIFTHAPSSIRNEPAPPKPPGGGPGRPVFKAFQEGTPIPVPEPEAESETIRPMEQNQLEGTSLATGLGDEGLAGGGEGEGTGNPAALVIDDRPDPGAFVPVEQQAKLVDGPAPVYPELARLSKIEGTVLVRALVGKDGKVREAFVLRPVNELLEQAAIQATMSYVFLPAMQNGRPVPVWVTIPFRFSLH